ncbi:hypothetical protein ABPG74_001547 [Tetrahymena malaccensis]
MENRLISVRISKNGESTTKAKAVTFQQNESLRNVLNIFSDVLKINAKLIFSATGDPITRIEDIKNDKELVITEGEQYALPKAPVSSKNNRNGDSRPINRQYNYQIAVMGPAGVGKSCITNKFIRGVFISEYNNTLADSQLYNYEHKGNLYVLDILDTAGEEDFIALRTSWLNQRQCFLFVFSVEKRQSFQDLQQFFELYIQLYPKREKPVVLCGNKIDLEKREVTQKEGQELAQKYGAIYFEVSAKEGFNVTDSFNALIDCLEKKTEVKNQNKSQISQEERGPLFSICSFFNRFCS